MTSDETKTHKVLDAIRDQHGTKWIEFGTADHAVHFAMSDLHTEAAKVFLKISATGLELLRTQSREAFKGQIESWATQAVYRDGLVASHPGWCGQHYVLGDGRTVSPIDSTEEVIVAFEKDSRCGPKGTVVDAIATLAPLMEKQSFLLFSLGAALIGPLLRFAPPDYDNPLFEVVGKRGTGKTGLGIFAASVWCGDENSSSGGAETWFNTLNAIGEMRPAYSDRILVLDETNLIDADLDTKEGSKHLSSVIMQLQQTGEKVRYGDVGPRRHSRVVAFSTSNETLANLVKSKPEIRAAVLSRMVTILISKARNFGIFDHIPLGFETSEGAVERLRAACDENYGVFGEAFVRVIVAKAANDPEAFKARLRGLLEQAHLLLRSDVHHKRVRKALAFAMVAGHLAQRYGIIPKEWGSFVAAVKAVQVCVPVEEDVEQPTASQRLLRYARRHLKEMINVSTLTAPITWERFDASPGALSKTHGATKLMITVGRFKAAFPTNHTEMLRELRAENRLTAEGSKMVVKIPKALCLDGRCYLIDITKRP